MSQPKISVIVPVYNVENYLSKCLDSILAQDFDGFEIIAVDDGSTDSSGKILDEYSKKYPSKISIIHQKNKGQGGARNVGIEASNGIYLMFVDSDDYIESNALSILYSEIIKDDCDIAVCGMRFVDEEENILKTELDFGFPVHMPINVDDCKEVITISPGPCNKLIKRELFEKNEIIFPSKVWYEDFRTIPKILALAKRVVFTDEYLYYYFQRKGSTMHNSNIDRNYEIIDAMEDLVSFFKSNNLFDKYYNELEFITIHSVLWDSSARVLKSTKYHPILDRLRDYSLNIFPNCFNNIYFKKFINNNKLMRNIFFFCLRNRLYLLLYYILKLKG